MTASPTDHGSPAEERRHLRVIGEPQAAPRRVVVIGGGIAGLAAAHALAVESAGRVTVTVLESSATVGGKLRVSDVAGIALDEGAEAMQATRPEAVTLAREVGLERDLVHPEVFRASLWTRGRLRPMPPTIMGVPTDLRALGASEVLTPRGLLRVPLEYARPATRFDDDVSIGAFVEARLGREVVDALVEPLLGGVYAGRADALSFAATVPALFRALRDEPSLLRAAQRTTQGGGRQAGARRGPMFAGIRGGVGRLPGAVAASLEVLGATVRTGTEVRSVHRLDDCWRIIVTAGKQHEVLEAEELIVAVPPHQASELLSHICPPAANDLGLIEMSSMAIVSLLYPAAAVPPLAGSGFLVPPTEGRVLKAANYATSKWDWIAREARTRRARKDAFVVIRTSVGRLGDESALQRDDDDLAAAIHTELAEAAGVSAAPAASRVTRWNQAIPQYATGHLRRVERIRGAISGVGNLEVCGAAYEGVGVAAVIGSARSAAREVLVRSDRRRVARV